jgi:predicted transcriptional regulator
MQRYGYEGFPVISSGQIVGLLTRRAVDRALAHHLNLTAGSLMEAGSYSLKTSDTIDHLQALMASTGWGQIPVTEEDSQKVIGIVTRTDLLKTLSTQNSFVPGKLNYANLLKNTLPGPHLALLQAVANEAAIEHLGIYIVGGFVRDLLLNLPSTDFDIVVEGEAIQLARKMSEKFGGKVTAHNRFGTAKWQFKEVKSDFAEKWAFHPIMPPPCPIRWISSARAQSSTIGPRHYRLLNAPALNSICTGAISPSTPWRCVWTAATSVNCMITGMDFLICTKNKSKCCIPFLLSMIPPACCVPFGLSSDSISTSKLVHYSSWQKRAHF